MRKLIKTREGLKKLKRQIEESWAVFKILSPFMILSVNSFLEMLTQPVLDKNCQEGTDVISHRACQAHVKFQVNLQYCAVATFGYIPDAGWSLFSCNSLHKTFSSSTNLMCCTPFLCFLPAVALSSLATTHPTSHWQEFSLSLNDWQPLPQGGKQRQMKGEQRGRGWWTPRRRSFLHFKMWGLYILLAPNKIILVPRVHSSKHSKPGIT